MHVSTRPLLGGIVAAAVLMIAGGTAAAGRFSISESRFRSTWTSVSFTVNGGTTIRCQLTLEGSMHARTFIKSPGALLGYLTRIQVKHPCINGEFWPYNGTERNEVLGGTLSNTLPWHLTYKAFGGTLPNITQLRMLFLGVHFLINSGVSLCSYASTNEGLDYVLVATAGRISSATLEPTPELSLEAGPCFGVGVLSAINGSYTVLSSTTPMTVLLI